jgi:hypothetical protein
MDEYLYYWGDGLGNLGHLGITGNGYGDGDTGGYGNGDGYEGNSTGKGHSDSLAESIRTSNNG